MIKNKMGNLKSKLESFCDGLGDFKDGFDMHCDPISPKDIPKLITEFPEAFRNVTSGENKAETAGSIVGAYTNFTLFYIGVPFILGNLGYDIYKIF